MQSAEDVIELLSAFDGTPRSSFREAAPDWLVADDELADEPADISSLLTTAPVAIDELIRQSGKSGAAVQLALLELELAGRLLRNAAGRVSMTA